MNSSVIPSHSTWRRLATLTLAGVLAAGLGGCSIFGGGDDQSDEYDDADRLPGERIPVLVFEQELAADAALGGLPVTLPEPFSNLSWPQPGGYSTNVMNHLAAPGSLDQLWRTDGGDGSSSDARLIASPIVADGRIYVMDADSVVRAFSIDEGDELWETDLVPEGEDAEEGWGGGVAYENGKVFAVTGYGFVTALDAVTGEVIWSSEAGDPFHSAPTAAGGRVFAVTADNQTIALSQDDGTILWRQQGIEESAAILSSTSPAVAGSVIIAPYSSGELLAMRVENGTVLWSDSLSRTGNVTALTQLSDIAGRPVVSNGLVVAISHAGRFVAIDLRSGERVWTRDIGGVQTPWIAGDYAFVVTSDSELIAIRLRDGGIRWLTQLPRFTDEDKDEAVVWSGPILAGDRLILASSSGLAVSVSPYTGLVLGSLELPDKAFIAPIAANGMVYFYTDDATLLALR